jgi:phosphoglycerate dehydrogenase-like enzyme
MPRPVVVGLGPVPAPAVDAVLGDAATFVPEPGADDLAVATGAIARADAVVDADFLDRAPLLRVIARSGVGVDRVDLGAATARGIPVVITPSSGTGAVAEMVLAMALHLVKRLGPLTALVRDGRWADRDQVAVGDLDGATMGIVGYGRIGRRVGELATAFGMRVLAHDPVTPPPSDVGCPDLDALAAAGDVLTLHVPLTDRTRHLVDGALLARIRPGAILINCGRGGLLDLDAVLAALESGLLGGVGLDVFEPEPARHHPLFEHPNVALTPHVAGLSRRAQAATFTDAARGVLAVITGGVPAAVANPDWIKHRPSEGAP